MTGHLQKYDDEFLRRRLIQLLDEGLPKTLIRERLGFGRNIPTRLLEGTKYAHQKTR